MANSLEFPAFSGDRNSQTLYGSFVSGGASITSQDCAGFYVSQTGTGAYTITFGATGAVQKYPTSPANYVSAGSTTSPLLCIGFVQEDAANGQSLQLVVLSSSSITSSGTMTIVFNSAANTPANPTSGTTIRLNIEMKNSSTPRKGS